MSNLRLTVEERIDYLKNNPTTEKIFKALHDKSPSVRAAAIGLCGGVDPTVDLSFFNAVREDADPWVRVHAVRSAATRPDVTSDMIRAWLCDEDQKVVHETLIACRKVSIPTFVIEEWSSEKDPAIRAGAMAAVEGQEAAPFSILKRGLLRGFVSRQDAIVNEAIQTWYNCTRFDSEENVPVLIWCLAEYGDALYLRDILIRFRSEGLLPQVSFGNTPEEVRYFNCPTKERIDMILSCGVSDDLLRTIMTYGSERIRSAVIRSFNTREKILPDLLRMGLEDSSRYIQVLACEVCKNRAIALSEELVKLSESVFADCSNQDGSDN